MSRSLFQRSRPSPAVELPAQPWVLLLGLGILAALTRFPLPIDETRYLTVAWEMWERGDFLVPHLNGEPYSHKPPLLFWLIHAGWSVFGVNAVWPRLVPVLAAAALLWVVRDLARRQWPAQPQAAALAPLVLGGAAFFAAFSTFIMFDVLLALCVALAARATWRMGEGDAPLHAAVMAGVWAGLAILAKGPVALVFLVPLWLLGPWWRRDPRARGVRWWGRVGIAVLVMAAVALAWALPAASAGGEAYGQAILLKQTSQRVVRSFAHQRPFWYYAVFLPLVFLPWAAWPRAWRGWRAALGVRDAATRFLLAWSLPALAVLSLVSGKQPQYLMPLLAPVALLLARGLALSEGHHGGMGGLGRLDGGGDRGLGWWPVALALVALGGLMIAGALGLGPPVPADDPFRAWHRGWLAGVPAWSGLLVALCGVALPWLARGRAQTALAGAHLVTLLAIGFLLQALLASQAGRTFDLAPAAAEVRRVQAAGHTVAFWGDYHGQLGFVGRLEHPLPELMGPQAAAHLAALARESPTAEVLVEGRGATPAAARVVFPYRRKWWALVPVAAALPLLAGAAAPAADETPEE